MHILSKPIYVISLTSGIFLLALAYKHVRNKAKIDKERNRLTSIRERKCLEREQQFAQFRETFLKKVVPNPSNSKFKTIASITKLSVKELQQALSKGDVFAEEVLSAFIIKALEAQEEFNCITEFIPGALEKARQLDNRHMVKGPLHGIPFAVKDDTEVSGMDSTIGVTRNLYKPSKSNAGIVQCLESLGAIAFCRTNLPQSCVSFGSDNPIFGTTLNPLNKKLGPGGSSSGSGCLVAAGGAPFATGTDTGGSLRCPAHFCGISTLKPTSSRVSRRGCLKCVGNLPSVPGILSKTPEDVATIFQAMTESSLQNKIDGIAVPLSWNVHAYESKKKLRIGYYTSLPSFSPIGDTETVILRAKKYLSSMGHIVVPFEFPFDPNVIGELPIDVNLRARFLHILSDGNDEVAKCIKEMYESTVENSDLENITSSLKSKIFSTPTNDVFQDYSARKEELIHQVLDYMNLHQLDQIICPVMPFPALGVYDIAEFVDVCLYTMIWSWLDFPAGVVKFWKETGTNWTASVESLSTPQQRKDILLANEKDCTGMPIGVQIVGRPFQEELVLKTMTELGDINRPLVRSSSFSDH